MFLVSVVEKLLIFYISEIFNNSLLSIDAKNMNLLLFDMSSYGESNKLYFIFL